MEQGEWVHNMIRSSIARHILHVHEGDKQEQQPRTRQTLSSCCALSSISFVADCVT